MISVLLVAHTRLSLGYVLDHYRLLTDAGLNFTITRAPDEHASGVEQMMDATGLPRLPYCVAIQRTWDLALFATHGSEIFFAGADSRVHIQHGLGAGKLVDGQDFTYGPKWALWDGKPKYDVMLEASYEVRGRAVAACPLLADRIRVVGDLRADRLLAADRNRLAYRAAFGIEPDELAVVVISSFGPHSLFRGCGLGLIDELLTWRGARVLLSVHPHVWTGRHDYRAGLDAALAPRTARGLLVCGPGQDWEPFLAAADLGVIDHSSLGLYFSLLARPTVAVPIPAGVANLTAPVAVLRALSPMTVNPRTLRPAVARAMDRFDPDAFAPWRHGLVAHHGQAASRTRSVLYQLLGLPLPHDPLPPRGSD
jgi:hypothetical protein